MTPTRLLAVSFALIWIGAMTYRIQVWAVGGALFWVSVFWFAARIKTRS